MQKIVDKLTPDEQRVLDELNKISVLLKNATITEKKESRLSTTEKSQNPEQKVLFDSLSRSCCFSHYSWFAEQLRLMNQASSFGNTPAQAAHTVKDDSKNNYGFEEGFFT